jgi:sialidase-1
LPSVEPVLAVRIRNPEKAMAQQHITPEAYTILESGPSYSRHSEASMVSLNDGSLLLAWSRFAGHHDNAECHIAGMRSVDGGATWTEPSVMIYNDAGLNVMSPALRVLPDRSLGLVYSHRETLRTAHRIFRKSIDNGETWSDPVFITREGYKTGAHDRLTVLSSGRIIAPLHVAEDWDAHYLYVCCALSDDRGQTWCLSKPLMLPQVDVAESGANEPDVVERSDGSLLMVMRTAMGTVFRADSHDGGKSWEKLQSLEVVAPLSPSIIRRIPDSNDLLLIWNWTYDAADPFCGKRRRLSCAVSRDGGKTWPLKLRRVLEGAGPDSDTYAYPSCTFHNGQALLTYYHMKAQTEFNFDCARSLRLMRIPIDWLYGG